MRFLPAVDGVVRIICVAISANGKFIVCGEETNDGTPQASIFSVSGLKHIKTLKYHTTLQQATSTTDLQVHQRPKMRYMSRTMDERPPGVGTSFTSIAFSNDGHILAGYIGLPRSRLVVYSWEKGNILHDEPIAGIVDSLSFCPWDATLLITTGLAHFKFWKLYQESFRSTTAGYPIGATVSEATSYFRDVLWLNNDMLVILRSKVDAKDAQERRQHLLKVHKDKFSEDEEQSSDAHVKPLPSDCDEVCVFIGREYKCILPIGFHARAGIVRDNGSFVILGVRGEVQVMSVAESRRGKLVLERTLKFDPVVNAVGIPLRDDPHDDDVEHKQSQASAVLSLVPSGRRGELKQFLLPSRSLTADSQHSDGGIRHGTFTTAAISPDFTQICAAMDNGQILRLSLQGSGSHASEYACVLKGLHNGAIVDMDTAVRKPLLVTCGVDRRVCGYDYSSHDLIFEQVMDETPSSVSIDPSGTALVLGLPDHVVLYNILKDALFEVHLFPVRNSCVVRFSRGGHLVACAAGSGVKIFSTHSFTLLSTAELHRGTIQSLSWRWDDGAVVTSAEDGTVAEWTIVSKHRTGLISLQELGAESPFGSIVSHVPPPHGQLAWDASMLSGFDTVPVACVSSDGCLRVLPLKGDEAASKKNIPQLSALAVTGGSDKDLGVIVGASRSGVVFASEVKDLMSNRQISYFGNSTVLGDVNSICVSCDGALYFCGTNDGIMFTCGVVGRKTGHVDDLEAVVETALGTGFSELFLTSEEVVADREAVISELAQTLRTTRAENEFEREQALQKHDEVISRIRRDHELAIRQMRSDLDDAEERGRKQEESQSEVLLSMEEQQKVAVNELMTLYEDRLHELNEQMVEQTRNHEDELKHTQEAMEEVKKKEKEKRDELEIRFAKRIHELELQKEELTQIMEDTENKATTIIEVMEHDQDSEFEALVHKTSNMLAQERMSAAALRGESAVLRRRFENFLQEAMRHEQQQRQGREQLDAHRSKLREHETVIDRLRSLLAERNQVIEQKDRVIGELQESNQELGKFKFVMEFKNKEMEREMQPWEEELVDLKDQLKAIGEELALSRRSNDNLQLVVADKNMRIQALQREEAKFQRELASTLRKLDGFGSDFTRLRETKDGGQRSMMIEEIYGRYFETVTLEQVDHVKDDKDRIMEFARQRHYMARSLEQLQKQADVTGRIASNKVSRAVSENALLLRDIKDLREELKYFKHKYEKLKAEMKEQMLFGGDRLKTSESQQSVRFGGRSTRQRPSTAGPGGRVDMSASITSQPIARKEAPPLLDEAEIERQLTETKREPLSPDGVDVQGMPSSLSVVSLGQSIEAAAPPRADVVQRPQTAHARRSRVMQDRGTRTQRQRELDRSISRRQPPRVPKQWGPRPSTASGAGRKSSGRNIGPYPFGPQPVDALLSLSGSGMGRKGFQL